MFNANAFATPLFYWDNQDKLVPAKGCGIVEVEQNRFRFSQHFGKKKSVTENLRNYKGVRQSHLVNSSLVKLMDGQRKKDYQSMEVVAQNQLAGVRPNRWFSKRGDKGYLYTRSLLPADDYILSLKAGTPSAKLGDIRDSLEGTMWHIAVESSYFKLVCGEFGSGREYILFRVYTPENLEEPAALVGVYWDETSIFRSYEALSKQRAHKLIPTVLDPIRVTDLLSDANSDYIGDLTGSQDPSELVESLPEETAPEVVEIEEVKEEAEEVITGSVENVVCIGSDTLNVRGVDLRKVLFSAVRGEKVKVFQSWEGENEQVKEIGGVAYTFVKAEFPDREAKDETVGWVAKSFVKAKANCKWINNNTFVRNHNSKITSIDDKDCCEFPLVKKATHAYTSGMRKFKAGRSGGRLHAACDLYRKKDEPALSVGPGVILRNLYYFYEGTYALEIRHDGGFVARYGELTGTKASKKIAKNEPIKMGDRVGYIGKVNSNCCRPMLHFELYSGEKTGALTDRSSKATKYQRRRDLMNPTPYLLKWEDGKF